MKKISKMIKYIALIAFVFTAVCGVEMAYAAGYIKENTVLCMSQKDIETYLKAVEKNEEEFVQGLFASASCYTKKRQAEALYIEQVGDLVEVKTRDGFQVWLQKDGFINE
jgi:hypothetical protein